MIQVSPRILIPDEELTERFIRASGPGGQNVNKVNSKAVLKWNVFSSLCLEETLRARLIEKLGTRINAAGEIVVTSDRYRDQGRNREDCVRKLHAWISEALYVPPTRKKTRLARSVRKKNLDSKRRHSDKKRSRSRWKREM